MSKYFSEQRGLRRGYTIVELRIVVRDLYNDVVEKEYLKEWLGYICVDAGRVYGTAGSNPAHDIVLEVGRADMWPPDPVAGAWPEDAIFDFLQFIGQKVSSGVEGTGRSIVTMVAVCTEKTSRRSLLAVSTSPA